MITARFDDSTRFFVFSPASSYPAPFARMIDRSGEAVHSWAHPAGQPTVSDTPPSFLRGWNHVEVAPDGGLFAIVPLHAVLRLDRDSSLLWMAEVPAHHDLHVAQDGSINVLTEHPRDIEVDGRSWTILDNAITRVGPGGAVERCWSLYDVLLTDPGLADLMGAATIDKRARYLATAPYVDRPRSLLSDERYECQARSALRLLRELPGSPCDVLHANTLESLGPHPSGLWDRGHWLVSFRELNVIAVIDVCSPRVVWWWGPGEVSGQHQPTALPQGTVLLLDNGVAKRRSRVIEIDPVTRKVVWEYTASPPDSFFTPVAGGCQQLSNGNVLVTDAQAGRAFEVDRAGSTVWDWTVSPKDCPARKSRASIYRLAGVRSDSAMCALGSDGRRQ